MGTFIINGGERIIVSQLVRSPGKFTLTIKVDKNGKVGYGSTVIPKSYWLELESDSKDIAWPLVSTVPRKIP